MASDEKVGWALSVLKHLPTAAPIGAESVTFYALGLEDLTDDELHRAVAKASKSCTFLPTPAELVKLAGGARQPFVDDERVLDAIRMLGGYAGSGQWQAPRVGEVRDRLGDGIAEAYGLAGGARLFADGETTRDIARREFSRALRAVVEADGPDALALVETVRALPTPPGPVIYGSLRNGSQGFQRIGDAATPRALLKAGRAEGSR